ncbi:hypothetical protein BJX61DRAFT_542754 [Aspergillus egyptiacus]|nr:hypothetical protein BJX61DRAFT_542754 [Aspergillus egyptiacus]
MPPLKPDYNRFLRDVWEPQWLPYPGRGYYVPENSGPWIQDENEGVRFGGQASSSCPYTPVIAAQDMGRDIPPLYPAPAPLLGQRASSETFVLPQSHPNSPDSGPLLFHSHPDVPEHCPSADRTETVGPSSTAEANPFSTHMDRANLEADDKDAGMGGTSDPNTESPTSMAPPTSISDLEDPQTYTESVGTPSSTAIVNEADQPQPTPFSGYIVTANHQADDNDTDMSGTSDADTESLPSLTLRASPSDPEVPLTSFPYCDYAVGGPNHNWINWLANVDEPDYPSDIDRLSYDVVDNASIRSTDAIWSREQTPLPEGDDEWHPSEHGIETDEGRADPVSLNPTAPFSTYKLTFETETGRIISTSISPSPSPSPSTPDPENNNKPLTHSDIVSLKAAALRLYSGARFLSLPQVTEHINMLSKPEILPLLATHLDLPHATATRKRTITTEITLAHPDATKRSLLLTTLPTETQEVEVAEEYDLVAALRETDIGSLRGYLRNALSGLQPEEIYVCLMSPRVQCERAAVMELYGAAVVRGEAEQGDFGLGSEKWWQRMGGGLEGVEEGF